MSGSPATVLLVEDDPLLRQSLGGYLRSSGFDVVEAPSGAAALDAPRPDLVILDVNLPDASGFDVCRRLRDRPETRSTPVLFMSGVAVGTEDRAHALEGGGDAYLVKPAEPREVLATIRALLRVHAAEEAARRAAEEWRTTFDALTDPVCLLDSAGAAIRCNRAATELLGFPPGEPPSLPFAQTLRERLHLPETPDLEGACRSGREIQLGRRWFRPALHPVRGPAGRHPGTVVVLADVTRARELEEQLRQSQKMEAIGRLAGGIAHDFNNLLTAILGNVELLQRRLRDETDQGLARNVERAGLHAADLTRQLLGFARRSMLWLRPTDLNEVVREVITLVGRTIDPRISLETSLAPALWPVQADHGQLGQVLLNLCLNARDAMPQGGRLAVTTANRALTPEYARTRLDARPGDFALLRVEDTGHGIAPEVLPRVFEPFFTTKGPGHGTGLGLAVVHGIVQQHHGWVECYSEPDRGTRFDVYLPRHEVPPPEARPETPGPVGPAGRATILVAEDEDMLRTLVVTVLGRHGFEVIQARDGQEAVDVFLRERARIDAVLLDLVMPRVGGRDVLAQIRQAAPEVPVVLTSGFAETPGEELERLGIQGFVSKPYRDRDLLGALRAALEGAPRL
jgi:PAS domain S-box-containing protein